MSRLVAIAVLCAPLAAAAQEELQPPKAIGETTVAFPEGAPPPAEPVAITVKILVDVDGSVKKVELASPPSVPALDEAVLAAARAFRFEPGRFGGKPVPVEITFTHTFLPPPPPPPAPDEGPPLTGALAGRLVTMGTRAPVTTATVTVATGGRHYSGDSDASGRFRVPVPAGEATVTVSAPGYNAFAQKERVGDKQELAVTYYLERERYDPYEIVVFGEKRREEVSRVTLRGPEIQQVPGTFGDPFRVIATLPGVAAAVSLLPFPIVRGASPSSTGFLLDGTRVPLLFHLLSGPSVIHPDFIDEVEFYPGGAPVPYGGYTGGIVDGQTRRARPDEKLIELNNNIVETGGLVRQPLPFLGATVTLAARYGFPGLILSLATKEASLSYWDYQLRLDGGNARDGWTLFVFGARDELDTVAPDADPKDPSPPLVPSLILGFHRVDLRFHHGVGGDLDGEYRVVAGYDRSLSSGTNVATWLVEPSLRWRWRPGAPLALAFGLEGSLRHFSQDTPSTAGGEDVTLAELTGDLDRLMVGGAYLEAFLRPSPRWLIRPGVRADVMRDASTTRTSVDPRLTVRYRLAERDLPDVAPGSDEGAVWLKGSVGIYHQPPRFVLPLPGLDIMPLRFGLGRAVQTSAGVEVPFAGRFSLDGQVYFSYLDPTIFDLSVNEADLNREANGSLFPTTTVPPETQAQETIDRLLQPQTGRAYGLELLARRQAKSGPYGWISYTLSRSERLRDGKWTAYDFDRTHLLNLVAGLPLPRNWDLGLRFQYQSGKPATTTSGYNTARTDGYVRVDLRIDKRAVWRSWLLDFYVDIANVALLPEEVTPGNTLHYVLPTIGVRGRF